MSPPALEKVHGESAETHERMFIENRIKKRNR